MKNLRKIMLFAAVLSLISPVLAADSQNVTGIKTGVGLFAGAMEYLGIRRDQTIAAGQMSPVGGRSLVEKYETNRAKSQNVDFGK
jgi:hypothetical protein